MSSVSCVIVPVGRQDITEVVQLLKQTNSVRRWEEEKLRSIVQNILGSADKRMLCAKSFDNKVRGFSVIAFNEDLRMQGRIGIIEDFWIDERFRGFGIGRKMMAALIQIALNNHCQSLSINSVLHRERAHGFYARFGFTPESYSFRKSL